jgi:transposase
MKIITDKLLYVGLDVDDKNFHGFMISAVTEKTFEFKCRPTIGALMKELNRYKEDGYELKCCYEATYIGYSLHRDLKANGVACEVIAPSLIPEENRKKRKKTDKLDCRKLAKYYMKNLLTPIYVPSVEDETVRNLCRSRNYLSEQLKAVKQHILSILRSANLSYRQEINQHNASYWTETHRKWLRRKIQEMGHQALKDNLLLLITQIESTESLIEQYDIKIEQYSTTNQYKEKVAALKCIRGINTHSAMSIVTEIIDIRRFKHPRSLTSFIGLDLEEYSSGENIKKFGITKMGNKNLRTTVVECFQCAIKPPRIGKSLKERRQGISLNIIAIADKCMDRLYKKSMKLLFNRKHINKVKIACAREALGFIWEMLNAVDNKVMQTV